MIKIISSYSCKTTKQIELGGLFLKVLNHLELTESYKIDGQHILATKKTGLKVLFSFLLTQSSHHIGLAL